jgi:hypothetical protein
MDAKLGSIPATSSLTEFAGAASAETAESWFLVKNGAAVVGLVSKDMALRAFGETDTSRSARSRSGATSW